MDCEVFVNRQRQAGLWSAENNSLRRALVISLALHGVIFFPAMTHPERPIMTLPLRVRMASPEVPLLPAQSTPLLKAHESDWTIPEHTLKEGKLVAPAQAAHHRAPVSEPPPPPSPASTVLEPLDGALEADALRSLRVAVAVGVRQLRSSEIAQVPDLAGEVVVGVRVGPAGVALKVVRSSGARELDELARQWVAAAVAKVDIPSALRTRSFDLELPILFSVAEPHGLR